MTSKELFKSFTERSRAKWKHRDWKNKRVSASEWPPWFREYIERFIEERVKNPRPQGHANFKYRLGRPNKFPFESVPPHLRPVAIAKFNQMVEDCQARGKPLTQGKIASLRGNATRYATQVYTDKWRRKMVQWMRMYSCVQKLNRLTDYEKWVAANKKAEEMGIKPATVPFELFTHNTGAVSNRRSKRLAI
jgi:hypothetical protein